jgi:hypothetical protein
MAMTQDEQGHWWWPADDIHQRALMLQSVRLDECVAVARRESLRGVFGPGPIFREADFDVLDALPGVEEAQFHDVALKRLDGLYRLPRLTLLRLSGRRPAIDLTRLPHLRHLVLEHHRGDRGLDALADLSALHLWRFRPEDPVQFAPPVPGGTRDLLLA